MVVKKEYYKKTSNYLHYTLGFTIPDANKIIKRFGILCGKPFPSDTKNDKYISRMYYSLYVTGEYIQQHWDEFMKFYGSVKKDYKRPAIKETKSEGYVYGVPQHLKYNTYPDDVELLHNEL